MAGDMDVGKVEGVEEEEAVDVVVEVENTTTIRGLIHKHGLSPQQMDLQCPSTLHIVSLRKNGLASHIMRRTY